ncbi:MAG: N-acetylmuramoyl-L-alanine amidase [Clostridia bacterium]|nr:N-acetylmuramoyl-L-alanine amidase [Clostridia bacterium]
MKIITVNLKKPIKYTKRFLILIAFILLIALSVRISSHLIENSDEYQAVLSEITDKQIIIIDAGHGGEDCGSIGVSGVYEKDLNLSVANALGDILREKGFAVVFTRCDDKLLYTDEENIKGIRKISDLKNRCKIAREYPNSIFVSIHMNSFSEEKYTGLQVYYSDNNESSSTLATTIQNNVKNTLQKDNNRNPKCGKEMYLLENIDNTAILIECGFISNMEECDRLSKKEYQKELSFAISCGIIEYIEKMQVEK